MLSHNQKSKNKLLYWLQESIQERQMLLGWCKVCWILYWTQLLQRKKSWWIILRITLKSMWYRWQTLMALLMEIIDALWLPVILTENGQSQVRHFILPFITPKNSAHSLWKLRKSNSSCILTYMGILQRKISSNTEIKQKIGLQVKKDIILTNQVCSL